MNSNRTPRKTKQDRIIGNFAKFPMSVGKRLLDREVPQPPAFLMKGE